MEFRKIIQNIQNKDYYPTYENTADDAHEGDSSVVETPDPMELTAHDVLAVAAMKNQTAKAGTTFEVSLPPGFSPTAIDLRSASAMGHDPNRALLAEIDHETKTATFLATSTAAIEVHPDTPIPLFPFETSDAAAD